MAGTKSAGVTSPRTSCLVGLHIVERLVVGRAWAAAGAWQTTRLHETRAHALPEWRWATRTDLYGILSASAREET
jgi:hypothetical protein